MPKDPTDLSRRTFVKSAVAGAVLSNRLGANREQVMAQETKPAEVKSSRVERYPFYRAEGTHRQLGQQHGEQAKEHIKAHLDFMCASMKFSRDQLQQCALRFRPLFDKHCPHLVDEIEGLGEGAGISLADALATNIRGALSKAPDDGCTAFVIAGRGTRDGQILIGQNSDMLPAASSHMYNRR